MHDFWASTKSQIAREAPDRIGKFYDIERDTNGQPADMRHAMRQKLTQPKASRHGLARQEAFSLFLINGHGAIDNAPAERTLRPIGIGRKKKRLCAGADPGAQTLSC